MTIARGTVFWAVIPGDKKSPPDEHPAVVLDINGDFALVAFGTSRWKPDPVFTLEPSASTRRMRIDLTTYFDLDGVKAFRTADITRVGVLLAEALAIKKRLKV